MSNPKVGFFDGIADKWDGWDDLDALAQRFAAGLAEMGVGPEEAILDVGCGTGNLTKALLERLGPKGRVVAVDISPRMIEVAKGKVRDQRVAWHVADARRLPLDPASFDRVVCYSVWPHFDDAAAAGAELSRVLRPSGSLHVWHLISRAKVNEIHASASPAVHKDILQPAEDVAWLLSGLGFKVINAVDCDTHYLVSATKAEQ
ncbi:MAG TPA: class I SAM-dependent methyltransferase [Thermoanaerobaculales bacterium]|nr:class I SAM-dependent methyltransferase [Thermoanaerobaculales bacterium]